MRCGSFAVGVSSIQREVDDFWHHADELPLDLAAAVDTPVVNDEQLGETDHGHQLSAIAADNVVDSGSGGTNEPAGSRPVASSDGQLPQLQ